MAWSYVHTTNPLEIDPPECHRGGLMCVLWQVNNASITCKRELHYVTIRAITRHQWIRRPAVRYGGLPPLLWVASISVMTLTGGRKVLRPPKITLKRPPQQNFRHPWREVGKEEKIISEIQTLSEYKITGIKVTKGDFRKGVSDKLPGIGWYKFGRVLPNFWERFIGVSAKKKKLFFGFLRKRSTYFGIFSLGVKRQMV